MKTSAGNRRRFITVFLVVFALGVGVLLWRMDARKADPKQLVKNEKVAPVKVLKQETAPPQKSAPPPVQTASSPSPVPSSTKSDAPPAVQTAPYVPDPSIANFPGGPRSRSAMRRLHPQMIQEAKAEMREIAAVEARHNQSLPAAAHMGAAPAPSVSAQGAQDLQKLSNKAEASGKVLDYNELPWETRNSLSLDYSMLFYSQDPQMRSITLNGKKITEGQEISAGLKLEEVTRKGAVFSYRGSRFIKTVMGD